MTPTKFHGWFIPLGKGQDEYRVLPAHRSNDHYGYVTSCWKLTFWERVKVLFTGRIFWRQMTFNDPLQPQLPSVDNPLTAEEVEDGEMLRKRIESSETVDN